MLAGGLRGESPREGAELVYSSVRLSIYEGDSCD